VGSPETREVSNNDATDGSWTEWADDGEPIRTEENTPPGADTDTVRYLPLGATEEEVVTPGQHYSYTGGPIEGQPSLPPSDEWQANTSQEPHLNNPNVTWVGTPGTGLHFTSHGSSGRADWFYYAGPVTDLDYLWQKQVREWVPGNEETFDTEYRWPLLVRTYTPGEDPVECPSEPPDLGGDDNESPGPKDDRNPPPVQVAGAQAAVTPTAPAQVPVHVAAGLGETAPAQSDVSPLGLLMVMFGVLLMAAAAIRRRARV
jgi:hypothetical protein